MNTRVDEIADGIYRISTFVADIEPRGFTFNQFLIDAEDPLLYHTGMRSLFPLVSDAVASVVPLERLRWIAFAHVEADECGAVEQFLAAAPRAQVAHAALGCELTLDDLLSRPPVTLQPGDMLDLGGKELRTRRVRQLETPHVPHNWESQVLFEDTTRTLFSGDIASQIGNPQPMVEGNLVEQVIETEHLFSASALAPAVPATMRRLAELEPSTLAIMHGGSYSGDGGALLRQLAAAYEHVFPAECLPGTAPAASSGRVGAHATATAGP